MLDPFSIREFNFPEGFLWGSATAGHQIEGNNVNSQCWHYETEDNKESYKYDVSGMACNSYNMWKEDIALLKELKHQVFRMSIEWSRIEPREGEFQQKEVDHYLRILEALKAEGIQVNVTLVHFAVPYWFWQKGGIEKIENLHYFERYVNYIVPKIAHLVDFWCVLNEFNLTSADFKWSAIQYHARGYHLIKQYSNKPVSSAHALVQQHPKAMTDPFDDALARYRDCFNNEFFFHAIRTGELVIYGKDALYSKELKDSADYWAVNSYVRQINNARAAKESSTERYSFDRIDMMKDPFYLDRIDPECMFHNLSRLKDKPVYITENGCSCDDDDFRVVFIAEYLASIHEAIQSGVDVRGFYYWSLLDNYEWSSYVPKFGIVEVDREHDFKRTIKPSGYFLREIIENNGYKPEMLKKYIDKVPQAKYFLP